jgi:hypothetical protein
VNERRPRIVCVRIPRLEHALKEYRLVTVPVNKHIQVALFSNRFKMSKDIELEDLASKRRITHSDDDDNADPHSVDENIVSQDGTIGLWAWTSAAL